MKTKPSEEISDKSEIFNQYKNLSQSYNNAQEKILELEETLKIETINSEEQRAYIEILKQSLEQKMDSLGFKEFIKKNAENAQKNHIDFFVELQHSKLKF